MAVDSFVSPGEKHRDVGKNAGSASFAPFPNFEACDA
jgi:hypothetical protein